MSTKFNASAFAELDKIETPNFDAAGEWEFQEADEELMAIADFIASKASNGHDIQPDRISYWYTNKVKKDGGKFILGSLTARDELERRKNNDFDYFLSVYYPVWKDLDSKNKAIQLHKILCGFNLTPGKDPAEVLVKKNPTDTREYKENIDFFGAEDVLNSSNIINMAVTTILEKAAEDKKNAKEAKKAKKGKKNEDE